MLLSHYQTKKSALSSAPASTNAQIKQIFHKQVISSEPKNGKQSDLFSGTTNPIIQSYLNESSDINISNLDIYYQNHSKILGKIDFCSNFINRNDTKQIKLKSIYLNELPQLVGDDLNNFGPNTPYHQQLKTKTLNMIFQSLINAHSRSSLYSKMLRNYTYCDNYDDAPQDQSSQISFTKECFQILISMTSFLNMNDIKNLLKCLDDPNPTESELIIVFISRFISFHSNHSFELLNYFSRTLQDITEISSSLIAVILPLFQKLISHFVVSYRNYVAKSLVQVIIPLIKHPNFQVFYTQFATLIQSVNDAFVNLRKSVAFNMIRYFPATNVKKQVVFLSMIFQYMNDLNSRDFSKNEKIHTKLICLITNSIQSPSIFLSQVALRFLSQRITNQLFICHSKSNYKKLLESVIYCHRQHWAPSIQKESSLALSLLRKINTNWYDELSSNKYQAQERLPVNPNQCQGNSPLYKAHSFPTKPSNCSFDTSRTKISSLDRPVILSLSSSKFNTGLSPLKINSINKQNAVELASPRKKTNGEQNCYRRANNIPSPRHKINDESSPIKRSNDSITPILNGNDEQRNTGAEMKNLAFQLTDECMSWIRIIQIAKLNNIDIDNNRLIDLVKVEFTDNSYIPAKQTQRRASTSYLNRRDLNMMSTQDNPTNAAGISQVKSDDEF